MSSWRIYKFWRMGMSLVTYQVDTVDTIEEAFEWAEAHGIVRNKKRGILIKKEGDKRRIYTWADYRYYFGWQHVPPPPPKPPDPEPALTQLPLLEAPPADPFKSVWRNEPPIKRRL